MAAVEVGVGYVSVVPSARGFAGELQRQISGATVTVGARVGQQSGQAASRGMLQSLGAGLKAGAAAVAAGAAGLFAVSFGQALEREKSSAKLAAQLGLSPKESARAGQIAGDVYAKGYGESVDQVNGSLKALQQNGVLALSAPKNEIAGLSKAALNLSETFDADVGESAKAVGQLIRTGLVKNGKEGFDLLTAGFQSGADKAGDLIDTVNEYSTQWRKAGLSGSQAIGLINQGLQAGARDGDLVADAIKEFSIRAVDGSKTTVDGFKLLGLNADTMAGKFAKGGSAANGVLQLTLDKLRGIKDPVQQSQAAVALFGTQAEDLGASLLALDPGKAAAGLGKVGGAAERMGKTLNNTSSHDIEVFKRQALQGLANITAQYVLPALRDFGAFLTTYVLPPARTVGGMLLSTLVPALSTLWQVGVGVIGWLRDMGTWLVPIGILVGGFTAAILAQQIATAATTAVFSIYRGAILAWTVVQRGATIAQAAFNAVMNANPIMLVITAIVALAAALVVAYQRSETFRNIVQAAWSGIQTGAMWLWSSVLKPMFDGFMTGLRTVGKWATWLWSTVLSPVFSFIATAGKLLATIFAVVVFAPLYLGFKVLGAVAMWLWKNAISPVIGWIVAGFKLWWSGVKVYFDLVKAAFRAVGDIAVWLWKNAISPVIGWIVTGFKLWWEGVKVYFNLVKDGFKAVGSVATWLWKNAIRPAFDGVKSTISTVYNNAIKPVFDKLKTAVGKVGDAFGTAKDAIKLAWDKLRDITRKPVQFVVDTVYNNGIRKVWNLVTDAFGGKHLGEMKFAAGGVLPGYTPGRDVHQFYSPTAGWLGLSGGEAIMRPEVTRALGVGGVNALNAAARSGGVSGVRQQLGFAKGGIFGGIGSALSGAWDKVKKGASWLTDSFGSAIRVGVEHVVNPLISKIPGGNIGFVGLLKDLAKSAVDRLLGAGKKGDDLATPHVKYNPSAGVEQWRPVVLQALREVGQPSGLAQSTLRRMQQESGGNPTIVNRWDSNWQRGTPSVGLMQVIGPTFRSYAGKYRNKGPFLYGVSTNPLANIYASMRYALGAYGSLSRAYDRPGGYDSGGWLMPGQTGVNGLRQPEAILTPSQWSAVAALAAQGARTAAAPPSARSSTAGIGDLRVTVYVGNEQITDIARAEVRTAQGELIQVLNAS